MAVLDEDVGSALTQADGDDSAWSSPVAVLEQQPRDWCSPYERQHARAERERARADAAEARCEELRRSDVDARSRAGSFKWQLASCRGKLEASRAEVKELRRAVKAAQSSKAEVTRFERQLVNRHSILTPNRRAKLTPLSGTAEVVPVVNRGDPRGFV